MIINGYSYRLKSTDDYKCENCKSRYNSKTKHQTPHESKCRKNKANNQKDSTFMLKRSRTEASETPSDECLTIKRFKTEENKTLFLEIVEDSRIENKTETTNSRANNLILANEIVGFKQELNNVEKEITNLQKEYERLTQIITNSYNVCEVDSKKVNNLYKKNFVNPRNLLGKVKHKNGKTTAIYEGKNLASAISYIEWNFDKVSFVEVVLVATDSAYEKRGLAKFLLISLMNKHKVATWAEYNVLDFYKNLGFEEEAKLGWDLSAKISYSTHSVFCVYGFSPKDLEYLSINV